MPQMGSLAMLIPVGILFYVLRCGRHNSHQIPSDQISAARFRFFEDHSRWRAGANFCSEVELEVLIVYLEFGYTALFP